MIGLAFNIKGQDYVFNTFKSTRVINAHSTETLQKNKLDVRIAHRFGDFYCDGGPCWETFYGLETATDILFGAEYGITDNLMVGLNRTKGTTDLKQLINTFVKYRLMRQKTNSTPISLSLMGTTSISTMSASEVPDQLTSFDKFAHRMAYVGQIIVARKFSNGFSLQVSPTYVHRNLVVHDDENGIFAIGLASRIQLSKVYGLILDFTAPISDFGTAGVTYYPAFGIGLEIDTGGHVFQINFTNAAGLVENDYIPNTRANWGDGEFRLGFTISRLFNL